MSTLLDRIEELAGPAVAQAIRAEFGGSTCYVQAQPKPQPALRVVLHVDVHPQSPLGHVGAAIEQAVRNMREHGVHVREIGVPLHGLGGALIEALRSDAALSVPVSALVMPGAPIQAR